MDIDQNESSHSLRVSRAIEHAERAVSSAAASRGLRAQALLATESAIELAIQAPADSVISLLHDIGARCLAPEWTASLGGRIQELRNGILSGRTLPSRVDASLISHEDRILEFGIDVGRLLVSQPATQQPPSVSWMDAWLRHPAFDRVTPMASAFRDDRNFDVHVLQLAHEITHVLSLRGPIGFAITILRMSLMKTEMALWQSQRSVPDDDFHRAFLESKGIAPMRPGAIGQLPVAEVACSAALKLVFLQEVWRPALEGLAVFAESCVDPTQDEAVINDVALCIRNLFDVDLGAADWEAARGANLAFVAEFDRMLSDVVVNRGPNRLEGYLISRDRTYFCGYLVVRALASRWRTTAERPLTGAQVFRLMMHAFKFGTFEHVPDMDQPPDAFFDDAIERMQKFLVGLARLPKESILDFLDHHDPATSPGFFYWRKGSLIRITRDAETDDAFAKEFEAWTQWHYIRSLQPQSISADDPPESRNVHTNGRYLRQMLSSVQRAALKSWFGSEVAEEGIREMFRIFESDNALLPVGVGSARFWLAADADGGQQLHLLVPNTEPDPVTYQAACTSLQLAISPEAADQVRKAYERVGSPHMKIGRVAICDDRYFGLQKPFYLHVLYLQYEDWDTIEGCGEVARSLLADRPDDREELLAAIRHRLSPSERVRIEREVISAGRMRASSTLNWLVSSEKWSHGAYAPNVDDWRAEIGTVAKRVANDGEERLQAGLRACGAALQAVFGDVHGISGLVESGFNSATRESPGSREDVARALFKSGLSPLNEGDMDHLSRKFLLGDTPLLAKASHGWDVTPALTAQEASSS